jgi:similar to stage IV sporulation protein
MRYRKRTGLIVGLVLAAAMVFYLSNTVLTIEVYGNESMSDADVISVLGDYGISIGKFIPNIDLRKCERQIITAFDKFSWIGIRSVGCRILVEVSEITEKPEMVPTYSPCNVISSKDAQIVEIKNVYMGMLVPMLYDGVKKGDLLISGTVDGKLQHDYYVHAMGEIIGRYDEKVSFFQSYEDTVTDYSERYERRSLYLFGLRIPLYIAADDNEKYEYSETLNYLSILNLKMPIGIIIGEVKPYTEAHVTYSDEQVKSLLEEKINNYERNFLEDTDVKMIDKKTEYITESDGISVNVTYTLEGNIGVTQEIMAKY